MFNSTVNLFDFSWNNIFKIHQPVTFNREFTINVYLINDLN